MFRELRTLVLDTGTGGQANGKELAQKAHSMYLAQDPVQQAKLLSLVFSNCAVDEVNVYPEYNIPFNLIAQRAKTEDWLGGLDSNQDSQIQSLKKFLQYLAAHRIKLKTVNFQVYILQQVAEKRRK